MKEINKHTDDVLPKSWTTLAEDNRNCTNNIAQTIGSDNRLSTEITKDYPWFKKHGEKALYNIAEELIPTDDKRNNPLIERPDAVNQHALPWHQYGIITHSLKFTEALHDQKNRDYLENQGINIGNALEEKIDGITKKELLYLVWIVHDIGKFQRTYKNDTPDSGWSHHWHESKWAEIIENKLSQHLTKYLESYCLTNKHINYITNAVAIHYELWKIRDALQQKWLPYTINSTTTQEYTKQAQKLAGAFPELQIEIWILPYFDKLATVQNLIPEVTTDEEITANTQQYMNRMREEHIDEMFLPSVQQLPVNLMSSINYLKSIWQTNTINNNIPEPYYSALYVENKEQLTNDITDKLKTIPWPDWNNLHDIRTHRNESVSHTDFLHHSTITFKPKALSWLSVWSKQMIEIKGIAYDDLWRALLVDNPHCTIESKFTDKDDKTHTAKIPHITMAIAKTVQEWASYSKELLMKSLVNRNIVYFDKPIYTPMTMWFTTTDGNRITSRKDITN